ncbi:MAG: CPBP family intramembrane glutamic endopeptidase, partial [Chitinophagaceae bacterium]
APVKAAYWVVAVALLFTAIPLVEYTGMLNRSVNFGKDLQVWAQGMEDDALKTVQFLLRKGSISHLVLNLVFIAGFAAVGEELFFRGVLQRLFIKGTSSPWAGIILAAFFFSFFHFQFFGFLPRLLLGIVLGAIFWYSGSLWTAIAAHFVYDAFIIMVIYFDQKMLQTPEAPMISASYLGMAAVASTVVTGLLIWWMKKNATVSYAELYSDEDSEETEKEITF